MMTNVQIYDYMNFKVSAWKMNCSLTVYRTWVGGQAYVCYVTTAQEHRPQFLLSTLSTQHTL